MRNPVLSVFLTALAAAGGGCADQLPDTPGPGQLRVVTYNVEKGTLAAATAAVLKPLHADILLLQEVDRGTARAGGQDQVAQLRRELGMNGVYQSGYETDGGTSGTMILSRHPILSSGGVEVDGAMNPAVAAFIDSPAGRIRVLSVHLSASPRWLDARHVREMSAVRVRQGQAIRRFLAAEDGPVIVGGDFNTLQGSREYKVLVEGFTDTGRALGATGGTLPAGSGLLRVDYVMVSKHFRPARLATRRGPSDHRMVVVDLGVVGAGGGG